MNVRRVFPIREPNVRRLCTTSYPGHPKGCPNYGQRKTCPPQARLIENVLDLSSDIFVVWNCFALGAHVERMRKKHPEWSDRQCRCCLYWQGTARKQLEVCIQTFRRSTRGRNLIAVRCPEACGVDVTETMASVGIELEWPPKNIVRQVALLGKRVGRINKVRRS